MKKYDLFWLDLNPTKGSEQAGLRPCIILQNNIANESKLQTVCIAPLTTSIKNTPTGIIIQPSHQNKLPKESRIELSQLRVVDRSCLQQKRGVIENKYYPELNQKIMDFFDVYDVF